MSIWYHPSIKANVEALEKDIYDERKYIYTKTAAIPLVESWETPNQIIEFRAIKIEPGSISTSEFEPREDYFLKED